MDESYQKTLYHIWGSDTLWQDLATLCSFGGRFAGTESEAQAREFLRQRLVAMGLGVESHEVSYDGWQRGPATLSPIASSRSSFRCHSLARSPATPPDGVSAEVVDLGRGTEEDFTSRASELAGRWALVRHEYMFSTAHVHRRHKYEWAKQHGAAGFIIAGHLPGDSLVTGSSGSGTPDDIPALGISNETAAALVTGSDAYPVVNVKIEAYHQPSVAENLIVDIPGQTPERVVLCAHYDGHDLAQSAIDNASGVACVLELARLLSPIVPSLRRGLRIALFTVEEWGLMGSRHYVDSLPDTDFGNLTLVVNVDAVVGSPRLTALTSEFDELETFLHSVAAPLGVTLGIHSPVMANSDHYNFARVGIPALRLVAGFNEPASRLRHLLTAGDTIDKVRPAELKTACYVAAHIVLAALSR
jgi:aminopeptidase YwaD